MTRAVVIGGGVAGLASAALLARGGAEVTLLERTERVGGRAGQFQVAGFTFDTGPSWYLMPEAFNHFFRLMGRKVSDYLDLQELDPRYRVFFEPRSDEPAERFDLRADPDLNWDAFERMSHGEGESMRAYAERAHELYDLALERFLYTTFSNPAASFDSQVLKRSGRLMGLLSRSLGSAISKRVHDPRLRQILGFHAVFLGSSPDRVPSLFSLMSHLDLNDGVRYPRGGFYAVVEALAKVAEEEGVAVRTRAEAARILVDPVTRRASGVALREGGVLAADLVVGAADMHHIETQLLTEEFQQHPESAWRKRQPGVSALLLFVGVDGELPELAHHNLFFTADWERNFDAILDERPAAPPVPASLYVSRATATDRAVAPAGKEALVVLVPFRPDPSIGASEDGRNALHELGEQYLEQIAQWAGVPKLAKRATVHAMLAPADFAREFHAWRGSALGLEHTLKQSAMFRPGNRSRRVRNLYYAGSSTVPGIGVPICLISAELVAKRILKDRGPEPLATPAEPGFLTAALEAQAADAVVSGETRAPGAPAFEEQARDRAQPDFVPSQLDPHLELPDFSGDLDDVGSGPADTKAKPAAKSRAKRAGGKGKGESPKPPADGS